MTRPRTASTLALAIAVALATAPAPDLTAQTTRLRAGQTVAGTLAAGDTARYTVEAGEDWFVFGEVNQRSVDVAIRILRPNGDQLGRADALGRGGERFSGELDAAGVYTIEVIPVDDGAGDYAITLHRLEPLAKDPKKLADQLMARFDGKDSPGAAIQVWRGGRVLFSKAYGMANLA